MFCDGMGGRGQAGRGGLCFLHSAPQVKSVSEQLKCQNIILCWRGVRVVSIFRQALQTINVVKISISIVLLI